MRAVRQTTLAKPAMLSGIGLHSGALGWVNLHPGDTDSGIVFHLLGPDGVRRGAPIEAKVEAVFDTRLGTCLRGGDGLFVRTIEHLLAAITIAAVDNVAIEIDGSEVPILDGSARPFLDAIERAGIVAQGAQRKALKIVSPVEFIDGERFIRVTPDDRRMLVVGIAFEEAAIGKRSIALDLDDRMHWERLSKARTFCRLADIDQMRAAGLGLGGSLENAIVVDGDRILNGAGLRDPDEFVLHKALDMVGDLALAGAPIIGRIEAMRPGHDLNISFLRRLLSQKSAVKQVVMPEAVVPAAL